MMAEFRRLLRDFLFRDKSGNFAILSALIMTPLILASSLAVDMGNAYRVSDGMQNALDAAALAAVKKYSTGGSEQDADTTARKFFSSNFKKNSGVLVTDSELESAFQLKLYKSSSDYTAQTSFRYRFQPSLVPMPFDISDVSVARRTNASQACVLALSPTIKRAFNNSGHARTDMTGCIVLSDSTQDESAYVSSNSSLKADCMYAAGGINADTASTDLTCGKARPYMSPLRDPFADVPMPKVSSSGPAPAVVKSSDGSITMSPGTYKKGFSIKGKATLSSGNYIIDGGTLTLNANADLTAYGVSFFLMNGASVKINGGAKFNITPPKVGDWAGFSIVADHGNTSAATINGNSDSHLVGIVYLPDSTSLTYSGNGSTAASSECIRLVAQTITLTGNSRFQSDCTAQLAGQKISSVMDPYLVR